MDPPLPPLPFAQVFHALSQVVLNVNDARPQFEIDVPRFFSSYEVSRCNGLPQKKYRGTDLTFVDGPEEFLVKGPDFEIVVQKMHPIVDRYTSQSTVANHYLHCKFLVPNRDHPDQDDLVPGKATIYSDLSSPGKLAMVTGPGTRQMALTLQPIR